MKIIDHKLNDKLNVAYRDCIFNEIDMKICDDLDIVLETELRAPHSQELEFELDHELEFELYKSFLRW